MQPHIFDAETGKEIAAHEKESYVVGFVSWRRLHEVFKAAGEITKDERAVSWKVDDRGITFRVI